MSDLTIRPRSNVSTRQSLAPKAASPPAAEKTPAVSRDSVHMSPESRDKVGPEPNQHVRALSSNLKDKKTPEKKCVPGDTSGDGVSPDEYNRRYQRTEKEFAEAEAKRKKPMSNREADKFWSDRCVQAPW